MALDQDPGNRAARLNLGALLLRRPDAEVAPVAETDPADIAASLADTSGTRLVEAARHLGFVIANSGLNDAEHYRALYSLVICDIYRNEPTLAEDNLAHLDADVYRRRSDSRLRALFQALEVPRFVAKRMIGLLQTGELGDISALSDGWITAAGEYSVACLYAARATLGPAPSAAASNEQALVHLWRAVERQPAFVSAAKVDRDFDNLRSDLRFASLIASPSDPPASSAEPKRYEITVDPGPSVQSLVDALLPPQ
jgi:hypothetical protein